MASQRTAFAIAGDGPIQTDDFPILEYEAPKAFFIGKSAYELFLFDERTWQFPLASRRSSRLYAPLKRVRSDALQTYAVSTPELNKYIAFLQGAGKEIDPRSELILRQPSAYPETVALPSDSTPEYKALTTIELSLLRHPETAREKFPLIEKILQEMLVKNRMNLDFSAQFYAALALVLL